MRIVCLLSLFLAFSSPLAAQEPAGYRLLRIDDRPVKWGAPDFGGSATVSYAFLTEAMSFPDARNCKEMAPMNAVADASGVGEAALKHEAEQAFALWEAVADVKFVQASSPSEADIIIGAELSSRGSARTDALAGKEPGPIGVMQRSLICLSTAQSWKVGFSGEAKAQDLRYTFAHEIGHALGLNHPGPEGEIMSFRYGEAFRKPQPGDVAGAVILYGAPHASGVVAADGSAPAAGR